MLESPIERLNAKLKNPFHLKLFQASLVCLNDKHSPLRATHFATAFRELTRHVLAELAPSEDIRACTWYVPEPTSRDGITRRHRAHYLVYGGLAPTYAEDILGLDVAKETKVLLNAVDKLSKYVHIEEDTFRVPPEEVDTIAISSITALTALLDCAEECKRSLSTGMAARLHNDVLQEALRDVIDSVDILATHHTIEGVQVEDVEVERVTASHVHFKAYGYVEVELQWGSNSDLRRGEGAVLNESFPLTCRFTSPVATPETLLLERDSLNVDNSEWFGTDERFN